MALHPVVLLKLTKSHFSWKEYYFSLYLFLFLFVQLLDFVSQLPPLPMAYMIQMEEGNKVLNPQRLWLSIAKNSRGFAKFPHVYSLHVRTLCNLNLPMVIMSTLALLTLFWLHNHWNRCFFTNSNIKMRI